MPLKKSYFPFCLLILLNNVVLAQQPKLMLPIGHTDLVNSVRYSPDGKKIVTASKDHTAKIWDAISGKFIADLKGHTDLVKSAQFSPDGKKIVTTSEDNTAKIWDAYTGNLLRDLKNDSSSLDDAMFTSNEKKIITIYREEVSNIIIYDSGI